jgi:hypothetical protein
VGRRLRVVGTWVLAALAPVLGVFAFVGSTLHPATFWAIPVDVPPAAMAVLALCATTYAGVGALLATRLPRNAVGWLLLGMGDAAAVTLAGVAYVAAGLRGAVWADWLTEWVSLVPFALGPFVLLVFPDGRLPSARWRPAFWLACVASLVFVGSAALTPYTDGPAGYPNPVAVGALTAAQNSVGAWLLLAVAIAVAAASFVARFRSTAGLARVQLEWFAFAAALVAVGYVVVVLGFALSRTLATQLAGALVLVLILCFTTVPVACGVAVLRYRLYDLDRVVSRTVAYLTLTGIVVGVYAAVVTAASAVLPDGASQAVVATATLAAAAAFEPARRRVQHVVDHRFNRQRYDAQRLVERYADGLRRTVDPDGTQRQLVGVVRAAVEPSSIAIWVRPPELPSS